MEELLREEEKGVIREEGGVVEEGEAFLNRLDEHCEVMLFALCAVRYTHSLRTLDGGLGAAVLT